MTTIVVLHHWWVHSCSMHTYYLLVLSISLNPKDYCVLPVNFRMSCKGGYNNIGILSLMDPFLDACWFYRFPVKKQQKEQLLLCEHYLLHTS
jgi:hypothetical protein